MEVIGVEHYIEGEGKHGAPYSGFINIADCANVTVRDVVATGHKTYRTIGRANRPVSMGTYDLHVTRAINVLFVNCSQSNDIKDGSRWGIMASNYGKNLEYDGCTLSRFDAHKGVCNATVKNSTIGHAGLNAIGHGILTVENTIICAGRFINMRPDYGSTWDGEYIIRNCTFKPSGSAGRRLALITGRNEGQHDFGYECHLPGRVTIDGLRIEDKKHADNYIGPVLFADFNPKLANEGYVEKFPVVWPKEVMLKNIETASGKELRICDNSEISSHIKVER